MEYKVIFVRTKKGVSTNFQEATNELAELVNAELQNGWEPIGGVATGRTRFSEEPHLFQAVIKR